MARAAVRQQGRRSMRRIGRRKLAEATSTLASTLSANRRAEA